MCEVMQPEKPALRRTKTNLSSAAGTSTQFSIPPDLRDDAALVNASKSGDFTAFDELVKRYHPRLLRTAQRLTHNHEDAQEVVQNAWLKAFQNLDQFRGNSKFSTWMFRINVNEAHMKMRGRPSSSLLEAFSTEDHPIFEVADPAPNPEELCYAAEVRRIVLDASKRLRLRLSKVFLLRDIEGLSIDQTAKRLHANESTVKSRHRRARIQIRDQLRQSNAFQTKSSASTLKRLETSNSGEAER
jgi:RNA polymerase sigma-70 factor (ECF subfamily)